MITAKPFKNVEYHFLNWLFRIKLVLLTRTILVKIGPKFLCLTVIKENDYEKSPLNGTQILFKASINKHDLLTPHDL